MSLELNVYSLCQGSKFKNLLLVPDFFTEFPDKFHCYETSKMFTTHIYVHCNACSVKLESFQLLAANSIFTLVQIIQFKEFPENCTHCTLVKDLSLWLL